MSKSAIWRRAALLSAVLLLIAACSVFAAPSVPLSSRTLPEDVIPVARGAQGPEYVEGELIVKLRPMMTAAGADVAAAVDSFRSLNVRMGAVVAETLPIGEAEEAYLVRIPAGLGVEDAAMLYESKEFVEYAVPNYLRYPDSPVSPNDFWFTSGMMWGLDNEGQEFGPDIFWEKGIPGDDIHAREAWGVRTDASSVLVAVIDTGVQVSHVDLVNNIWTNPGEIPDDGIDNDGNGFIDDVYGWDFKNDDNSVYDDQTIDRHGTHVSGTIGAEGNNGIAGVGVAWKARIMSCKFLGEGGGTDADAIKAIDYARKMGAKIASCSWGGGGDNPLLKKAMGESGMLFVCAAGNDALNNDIAPHYPSSYDLPNLIAVAASDWNDNLVNFSCYGAESVDLAAPGHWIVSCAPFNSGLWMGGTSMATPHVSGAAALVAAEYPDMPLYSGAEGWSEGDLTVKDALLLSVDRNPAFAGKMTTGGRLNVANAIKRQFPVKITSASADVTFGAAPLTVNFSASVQYPTVVERAWWSFGEDPDDVTGYIASRTYGEEGAYMAWFHAVTVDGVESRWPVQVVVADPGTIVYVDDDGGFGFEALFMQACEAAELKCVVVDPRYPLGLADDFNDRMLAWNTSFSWSDTLLTDQEEYLAGFLDGGGRLFMISPEYLYDMDELTPFAEQYLHVWDYVDNVAMGYWDGIAGDPITDGMSITAEYGLELEDALWPDLNAKPILKHEDYVEDYVIEIWPALRYADETYRMVFTTVPWEELPTIAATNGNNGSPTTADKFLVKVYDYLMGEINTPPTIDKAEADIYVAYVGEEIAFTAEAHDIDDDEIAYLWQLEGPDEDPIDPVTTAKFKMAFDEPGSYAALLTVTDERGEWTKKLIVVTVVKPGSVVFVDDDDADDYFGGQFDAAFEAIEQDYVTVWPELITGQYGGQDGLERFRVAWNCGEEGTLDEAEQKAIAEFLGKGGRLLLCGQEVMYGLGKSPGGMEFARNYLHVLDVENDVGTAFVTGVEGDPITGNIGKIDLVFPEDYDDWTDSLEVAPEAHAIFFNDQEEPRPCALRYSNDKHRLVFMAVAFEAFPLEPVEEPADVGIRNGAPEFGAAALLGGALEWLDTPVVTVTKPTQGQVCTGLADVGWTALDYAGRELTIKIEYSIDKGDTWTTLATGEENDGIYKWDLTKLDRGGEYMVCVIASRADGASGSGVGKPFVVAVAGANRFVAGPNPASDAINFYINASGEATLYVYDIAGRQVFSQEIESGQTFFEWHLVNKAGKPLANGLYLCYMVTADGVKTDIMRLVISR